MQKNIFNNKKGAAGNELLGWVILFGLIGLIGAIFGLIQTDVQEQVDSETISTTSTFENITITNAGIPLTACAASESGAIVTFSATNSTGGGIIGAGNYTYSGCIVTAVTTSEYNNTIWGVTYGYSHLNTGSSWAHNNSVKAQEAQGKIFGKLPLVGTIVVLSLILMLVLGVVAYFQNRQGASAQYG